ncbi:Transferase, partial [Corchorus capsularis]
ITRLKCGGFVFAIRLNHVMCDAAGLIQFMSTVAEMAHGATTPSIPPVWERHLLDATEPPRVMCKHNEYDEVEEGGAAFSNNMVERAFFFGRKEFSSIHQLLPLHLRRCSTFELLTACLWRCRTVAINLNPNEEARLMCIVNVRSKFHPPLPLGYYGNGFVFPAAKATSEQLCRTPLAYAVELVKHAKASVTEEYVKSAASLMVIKGKKLKFPAHGSFLLSDIRNMGFRDVDFGWGKAEFGGAAKAVGPISFVNSAKDKKGEVGALVSICLPAPAMEIFVKELEKMLRQPYQGDEGRSNFISSAL